MKNKILKGMCIFIASLTVALMFTGCGSQEEIPMQSEEEKIISSSAFIKPSQNDDFKYKIYNDYISISRYIGGKESAEVPETIEDKPVYLVEDSAFSGNPILKNVKISNNVIKIGESCFKYCSALETITLSEKIEEIPADCFSGCVNLKDVKFSKNIKVIGEYAYNKCNSLVEITIPGNIETVGTYAFSDCANVKSVTIVDGYSNSKDKDGNYPEIQKTIGTGAFSNLPLCEKVVIGKTVKEVVDGTFMSIGSNIKGRKNAEAGERVEETMFYGYAPSAVCTYCANTKQKFTEIVSGDELDKILQAEYPKEEADQK